MSEFGLAHRNATGILPRLPCVKKQNRHRDEWLLKQREKKERHWKQRQWARKYGPKNDAALLRNQHNPEQKEPVGRRVEIVLPESLDLEDNYNKTVTNLTNVRLASQHGLRGYRLR